jgi:hypothetical protein
VKFTVTTTIDKVVSCNCSICSKKGVLHHRVTPERFRLVEGEAFLSLYQFDTKEAKHYFCHVCGIHPFSRPRAAPDMYSVNVRCLDDFNMDTTEYEVLKFDGRHWEEAVEELNKRLSADKR